MSRIAPALHPTTKSQLRHIVADPPRVVGLTGLPGVGKRTVAEYLACTLLGLEIDRAISLARLIVIEPSKTGNIGIETSRKIQHLIKQKFADTTKNPIQLVVIIDHAEQMTLDAQNALLKTFEESPKHMCIVLCSPTTQQLLPTIISRTTVVTVHKPKEAELIKAIADKAATQQLNRAMLIAAGLPGLTSSLLSEQSDHPLLGALTTAKKFLSSNRYDRLCSVSSIAKTPLELEQLLYALSLIIQQKIYSVGHGSSPKQLNNWLKRQQLVQNLRQSLGRNAQTKLVGLSLATLI